MHQETGNIGRAYSPHCRRLKKQPIIGTKRRNNMQVLITKIDGDQVTQVKGEGTLEECKALAQELSESEEVEMETHVIPIPASGELIKKFVETLDEKVKEEIEKETEKPRGVIPDIEEQPPLRGHIKKKEEDNSLQEELNEILREGDPKHAAKEETVEVSESEDQAWNELAKQLKQRGIKAETVDKALSRAIENGMSIEEVKEAVNNG